MGTEKMSTSIRKEQIAQAAMSLLARTGLRRLSVAALAKSVGLVPSALYRHFSSKEELLQTVIEYIGRRFTANVAAVCQESNDPIVRLRLLLDRQMHLMKENQAFPRILFSDELYGGNPARRRRAFAFLERFIGLVAGIVRQGIRRRIIRPDVDPAAAAMMFVGIIQPAAVRWHMTDGRFNVIAHAKRAWRIYEAGITVNGHSQKKNK